MTSRAGSFLKPILKPVVYGAVGAFARALGNRAITTTGQIFNTSPGMGRSDYLSLIRGNYEAAELAILRRSFKRASTIVELGSNIGIIAYHALTQRMNDEGRMVCVEPNADSLKALKANTDRALRTVNAQVSFLNAAIAAPGQENQTVEFLARNNLGSGLVSQVAPMPGDAAPVDVQLTSLSDILRQNNIGEYSLICDIEGGEIPLLYQDGAALKGCTQMLIELHDPEHTGQNVTPAAMRRQLRNLGFSCEDHAANTYYFERRFVL